MGGGGGGGGNIQRDEKECESIVCCGLASLRPLNTLLCGVAQAFVFGRVI